MSRPKTEPRDKQLNLSLTASEFERLRARAEEVGMRPVHFGRAMVLNERHIPKLKSPADHSASRLLYQRLSRIGNNLNQLVRYLHQHGGPMPHDLEPLLRDIRRLLRKYKPR